MNIIDAALLKKMFISGAYTLESKKEWINELNVFPVPDGDTGTNMTMTIMSSVSELEKSGNGMDEVCKAVYSGALRGARGNSGVILSQLLRGFLKSIEELQTIGVQDIAKASKKAVETAYKAVMKPKEGTILTVAKGLSDKASELSKEKTDLNIFLSEVIEYGDLVLAKTPEMLPVLKQAGVVDSGGQGLMVILHGAYDAFIGQGMEKSVLQEEKNAREQKNIDISNLDTSDIRFGYCTEFIIKLEKEFTEADEFEMKQFLTGIGDSLVCVSDDEVVKIHVHTNDPGLAIQKALNFGQLSRIKIDNMREEHEERLFKNTENQPDNVNAEDENTEPVNENGFVTVCSGEGFTEIFKELGVDCIIEGGQTMNPSTEDILKAIHKVPAKRVYVLPNNKNIILAANQASEIETEREVIVVPSKTICQGISCMMNFLPEMSTEENLEAMKTGIDSVHTIEVTYAIRDTVIDDVNIKKGDYIAIGGSGILSNGTDLEAVVKEAVVKRSDETTSVVTVYYGSDVSDSSGQNLTEELKKLLPSADVELNYGGQPIYYYLISLE